MALRVTSSLVSLQEQIKPANCTDLVLYCFINAIRPSVHSQSLQCGQNAYSNVLFLSTTWTVRPTNSHSWAPRPNRNVLKVQRKPNNVRSTQKALLALYFSPDQAEHIPPACWGADKPHLCFPMHSGSTSATFSPLRASELCQLSRQGRL